MNQSFQVARILGIPIIVNASWIITLVVVTSLLALDIYPALIPADSPYRDDYALHWVMAFFSGVAFFTSIVLHELAHSAVALKQGIQVRNITLFIFGGVSQIAGEANKPLREFVMAIVGPLTSALLAVALFGAWLLVGANETQPASIVLEWLFIMNLVLAIFNMAPAFPMDGGRVFRAILWAITGSMLRATRWATLLSRGLGYALMGLGMLIISPVIESVATLNGLWFVILGLYIESTAKQSWLQAKALGILARFNAEDLMSTDIPTVPADLEVRFLQMRGGNRRYTLFVTDEEDNVVGIVSDQQVNAPGVDPRATAGDIMVHAADAQTAGALEDGATVFQRMELGSLWQLPVVAEGRVLGVISREAMIRLFTLGLQGEPVLGSPR